MGRLPHQCSRKKRTTLEFSRYAADSHVVLAVSYQLLPVSKGQKILPRSGSRTCTTLSNKCARSFVSIPSSRWTQNFRESSPDQLENLTQLLITNIRFVTDFKVQSDFWSKHKYYFNLNFITKILDPLQEIGHFNSPLKLNIKLDTI